MGVLIAVAVAAKAGAQTTSEAPTVQTRSEVQLWKDAEAAVCAAAGSSWLGAEDPSLASLASCPLADRALPRSGGQVNEIRDVGAFASGLADAAGAAGGFVARGGRQCAVRKLSCGQSVTHDLALAACGPADGVAAELFELPVMAGQSLRLELRAAASGTQLALADPQLLLRDSAWGAGDPAVVERDVEQTGRWGVAVTGAKGDSGSFRLDVLCDGQAVGAAPPDGTYEGTHSEVGDMRLVVLNNAITSFEFENFTCPFGTILETSASFLPGCAIASNGSFSCGNVGCSPFATNARIQGAFSGNTVAGNLTFNQKPDAVTTCCEKNLLFTATVGSAQTAPAAPSGLTATAASSTAINLAWQDNSNDEDDFRIEQKIGAGAFAEVGTASANATTASISGLAAGTAHTYRVRARNSAGFSQFSNEASATTPAGNVSCVPSTKRLCLQQDRFAVEVTFRTAAGAQLQTAEGYEETSDSGLFYFFEITNLEKLIKVLNACTINGHYWVFFAATTDVEFTVKVTDTKTGQVRTYLNPLGQAANAITDTQAFATCP